MSKKDQVKKGVDIILVSLALRALIEKSGKRHEEAAASMNMTPSSFSRMINGHRKILFEEAILFCRFLSIELNDLADLIKRIQQDKDLTKSIIQAHNASLDAHQKIQDLTRDLTV